MWEAHGSNLGPAAPIGDFKLSNMTFAVGRQKLTDPSEHILKSTARSDCRRVDYPQCREQMCGL